VATASVSGFGGQPGHLAVMLDWTNPDDADLAYVEIWAHMHDDLPAGEVGESTYPEFNDIRFPNNKGQNPSVPVDLEPDADWFMLAMVPAVPGEDGMFVHDADSQPDGAPAWVRAGYSYYAFAKDAAGNYSDTTWPRQSVNYILGDFDESGEIDIIPDVNDFAMAYGTVEGEAEYVNFFDIGPLTSNPGVPSTDNDIQFEDLMVLSLNFNAQGKAAVGEPETPLLAWYPVDDYTWAMGLTKECNSLKGLRVVSALPEGVTVRLEQGANLDAGLAHLLVNDARRGLDLGFSVLGENSVLPGSGEIFRVVTDEPVDLSDASVEVRDATNESIEFELSSEALVLLPTAYAVEGNFPNPFNPQTTIKFTLPEAQDVRMEIFDIRGYRVRVLVNEHMPAGAHSVVWNGRDGHGRSVASGTYFYRVQAGPLNDVRRMLLVK
jgi:hypothetical protein